MLVIKISKLHAIPWISLVLNINYEGCSLELFLLFWRYNFHIITFLKNTFFVKIRRNNRGVIRGRKIKEFSKTFAVVFVATAPKPRWRRKACNGLLFSFTFSGTRSCGCCQCALAHQVAAVRDATGAQLDKGRVWYEAPGRGLFTGVAWKRGNWRLEHVMITLNSCRRGLFASRPRMTRRGSDCRVKEWPRLLSSVSSENVHFMCLCAQYKTTPIRDKTRDL